MTKSTFPLLDSINSPADVRALETDQLPELAQELRHFLIQSLSKTGGHLASGLGAVELTIVLHYLFNTPDDRLVWDVGHQCYPHKILTGRRERMDSLRRKNGLSGFPKISESEYDHFGAGHSSTSISAALGMAIAAKAKGEEREAIAIIGDGGMSAGMAFEALNHAGSIDINLLVILNDNEMSISPNVGAMSKYLSRLWSGSFYASMRAGSKRVLQKIPSAWEIAKRAEEHVKGMVLPGTLFEELGFKYFGPIDGHDINELIRLLRNLQQMEGPRMLHIVTQKGKGFEPAEKDPIKYHGPGPFNSETGNIPKNLDSDQLSFTQVFSNWLVQKAQKNQLLHAITPAMREGSGLVEFSQKFPQQYHDVGIAEQHAITLAAGMAIDGLKPIVTIYSTFLQRAYDQLIHDVAIQNLDILFAVDRAGIVGADGATHTGSFDISYVRCIPNMIIMAPADATDMMRCLNTGYAFQGPALVRYPRDNTLKPLQTNTNDTYPVGKAISVKQGKKIALLVFGPLLDLVSDICDQLGASLINMIFVKPLDTELINQLAKTHEFLVTLEDNSLEGGAGSAVLEYINQQQLPLKCLNLGLKDQFPNQGNRDEVLSEYGLSPEQILSSVVKFTEN